MNAPPVYLDNQATTRVDPRVVEAMLPYLTEEYGNAGSVSHEFGRRARAAVDTAREDLAAGIGAEPRELAFTSGATESDNLALRGAWEAPRRRGQHIVSVATEHRAVLDPLERLARRGARVSLLQPLPAGHERAGWLEPDRLAAAVCDDTFLVSVMLANNEIGVVQSLAEIGRFCRQRGIWLHCDATQAVGKQPVDVVETNVDLLSFSAHKMHGPKGVGALYVRRGPGAPRLAPQIDGGGQEHGLRSGTLNVPGIVGFAAALRLCLQEMPAERPRLAGLRNTLAARLAAEIDGVTINGPALSLPEWRLPGNLNVSFAGIDGDALLVRLTAIAVSSGSACSSGNTEPSHVLKALGLPGPLAKASLRFGLGRFNGPADIDVAVEAVRATVADLRNMPRVTLV